MAQKYLDINGLERYHDGLLEYMSEAVGTQSDMSVTDPTNMAYIHNVPDWVRSETKPEYNATEVGADATGTAHTEVSNHNVSETAHEDIRNLIQEIKTQETTWNDKYTKEEVDNKDAATLASAKEYNDAAYANANAYTDQKIANLINGAPTTLDTLGEIATAMANNNDVVEALESAIGTKADSSALTSHTGNADIHFTAAERTKLSGIAAGANAYTHPSTHAASMITGLATVATSGSYNDLSNKPTIPTNTNQLTNGAGFITGITKTMVTNALGYTPPTSDTNTWRPLGTTADTACAGNDSRLSNARPASDVYSWAKASSKPSYTKAEVGLGNVDNTADSAKSVKYATSAGSAPANGGTATWAGYTSNADPAAATIKNIYAGTSAMTSGSSSLTTGTIYVQYE